MRHSSQPPTIRRTLRTIACVLCQLRVLPSASRSSSSVAQVPSGANARTSHYVIHTHMGCVVFVVYVAHKKNMLSTYTQLHTRTNTFAHISSVTRQNSNIIRSRNDFPHPPKRHASSHKLIETETQRHITVCMTMWWRWIRIAKGREREKKYCKHKPTNLYQPPFRSLLNWQCSAKIQTKRDKAPNGLGTNDFEFNCILQKS